MSLPFSNRKSLPNEATLQNARGAGNPPGTTSTARLSTSNSSNRPISTSSRGYSITSKKSLPEKQLLSRYRHVYAGKGGWFQGRSGTSANANYTSGTNSRHLDVYRKELIMKLSKDIFENSKQKLTSADYVVSNKVAGDPDGGIPTNDVTATQHVTTAKLGDNTSKQITHVESDTPHVVPSSVSPRDPALIRNQPRDDIGLKHQKTQTTKQTIKPVFHSLKPSNAAAPPSRGGAGDQSAHVNKAPIKINLRGGSSKVDQKSSVTGINRLNATTAAGYKPSSMRSALGLDGALSARGDFSSQTKHGAAMRNAIPELHVVDTSNTADSNAMHTANHSKHNDIKNDVASKEKSLEVADSNNKVPLPGGGDKTIDANQANPSTSHGVANDTKKPTGTKFTEDPKQNHNHDLDDSYLFAALKKRSNTFHGSSNSAQAVPNIKTSTRQLAKDLNSHNKRADNSLRLKEQQREVDNPDNTQEYKANERGINTSVEHRINGSGDSIEEEKKNKNNNKEKNTVDRQSQYLAKEGGESIQTAQKEVDTVLTKDSGATTTTAQKQNKRAREQQNHNNSGVDINEKSRKYQKSASASKSGGKKAAGVDKSKLEDNVEEILGEIQFNVLRQRSFIRMPKSVVAKNAAALDSERPTTREGNGIARQILSRMSLSKEAQDALQETRQEMRRESIIDLVDQLDITKLRDVATAANASANTADATRGDRVAAKNDAANKRPNSPKPESSSRGSTTASTQSSSARGSSISNGRFGAAKERRNRNKKKPVKDGQDGVTKGNKQDPKKFTIPKIEYSMDSSRDKFNSTLEQGVSTAKKLNASRASTVATPITDLVPAMPTKEKQEGYVRYSTNMSRDTPRGQGGTGNRAISNRNRKTSGATLLTTTRTSQPVPNATTRNGLTVPVAGGGRKQLKNAYTVPLKASMDDMNGDTAGGPINNGLPNDNESIRSDWESQLRAMSKYGLVTEKSFQITPAGWDERYKDLAKKNAGKEEKEVETTLAEVKEKAMEKCSDWLQKYV